MTYSRLRLWLFRSDPERAHAATLRLLRLLGALPPLAALVRRTYAFPEATPVDLLGLRFPNRVGLAAGYDKDALAYRGLACLGFGHLELGTVTPRPQMGNPKPRLYRLVEDEALINRMGFPSQGAQQVAQRLRRRHSGRMVLGMNLGINKDTLLESAAEDYVALMQLFSPLVDYLTINISSPNTPGLRDLQRREYLRSLLARLQPHRQIPLLVKLSPDLGEAELEDAIQVIVDQGLDGVIATNTTLARPDLHSLHATESGGLSGAPLAARGRSCVARIHALTKGQLPIIAAGGIMSGDEARAALDAGASLVQLFTGLIYRGPGLVRNILKNIN
jgi:dihydroorotate dehydrogenase